MGVNGNPSGQVTGVIEAVGAPVDRLRKDRRREVSLGTRYSQPTHEAKQKPRARRGFCRGG